MVPVLLLKQYSPLAAVWSIAILGLPRRIRAIARISPFAVPSSARTSAYSRLSVVSSSPVTGLSSGAREREHPVSRRIEIMVRTMVMLECFAFIFRCWCDLRPNETQDQQPRLRARRCKLDELSTLKLRIAAGRGSLHRPVRRPWNHGFGGGNTPN